MSYDASKFINYLDPKKSGLELVKDAPESAKKALREFQRAKAEAEKKGIKI